MKRALIGITAIGALGVACTAFAQERGGPDGFRGGPGRWMRPPISDQDRSAFVDARIAGLHAGLKLTPDQEKLWPPVEDALRNLARQRQEARAARRERFMSMRDETGPRDIPAQLRFMADRQAASADALRKLADASGPLYGALDEGQKRRLTILTRMMRGGMGRGPGMGPGMGPGPGPGMGPGPDRREMRRGEMDQSGRFAGLWRPAPPRGGPHRAGPQGAGPQDAGPQDAGPEDE